MRVLFTTNVPAPYRVDFFNELGKLCDLTVLFERQTDTSRNEKWIEKKVTNYQSVFMKGIKSGEAEAICPEIIKYLSLKKFDVIVIGAYHTPSGMLAIQYMKMKKIPFILSSDGGMKKEDSKFMHLIKEHFISSASAWLSTGKTTSEYLEYYGAKKEKTYIYPFTSIKQEDILEQTLNIDKKREIRKKLGIFEDKVILSIGQYIYRKGFDILLKACDGLDKKIGIYIIGGKPTEEYLSMQLKMNLTNVHFVDFKKKQELAEYYRGADLFVLPTREDIWGLVVNEAMAYGLPIVTTNRCVAGIEMVDRGKNGYLVESENVDQLYNTIDTLINNEEMLNTYSMKSIKKINSYTIEKMAVSCYEVIKLFASEK